MRSFQRTSAGFPLHFRRGEIAAGARYTQPPPLSPPSPPRGFRGRARRIARRRSRRKIAYELIADSYSACAARRSNLREISDNDEMNLLKRERSAISALAQKIANSSRQSAKIYRVRQNLAVNFVNGLLLEQFRADLFPIKTRKALLHKILVKLVVYDSLIFALSTFTSKISMK